MSDETQKQLISVLSTAIAFVVATRLAGNLVDQPEVRGVGDDVKEGLLQASFSLAATVLASVLIRRLLRNR